jgi:hypothetical protein
MKFLILVMQLIVLGEDIDSGTALTRSNSLDKLTNMYNSIRR